MGQGSEAHPSVSLRVREAHFFARRMCDACADVAAGFAADSAPLIDWDRTLTQEGSYVHVDAVAAGFSEAYKLLIGALDRAAAGVPLELTKEESAAREKLRGIHAKLILMPPEAWLASAPEAARAGRPVQVSQSRWSPEEEEAYMREQRWALKGASRLRDE